MKRAYLSDREKAEMCERQNWHCTICEQPFGTERIEYDHEVPHAIRAGEKPTQAVHKSCHAIKTKVDRKRIAKAKRLHRTFVKGEKRQKRKIQSRGFDRRWSKRFNGDVVPRPAPQGPTAR